MKLRGKIKVVEAIEHIIKVKAHCLRYKPNVMDDIKSGVCQRQYVVDTEPTLAVIKLWYDYRVDVGEVHIKDDKIWKFANALPEVSELMSKLEPYYRHKWIPPEELAKIWAEKNSGKKQEVKSASNT